MDWCGGVICGLFYDGVTRFTMDIKKMNTTRPSTFQALRRDELNAINEAVKPYCEELTIAARKLVNLLENLLKDSNWIPYQEFLDVARAANKVVEVLNSKT